MAECEEKPKITIRHDWYQTETDVVITLLAKNVNKDDLKLEFEEHKVKIVIKYSSQDDVDLCFDLSYKIVPEQSSYKITPSKVEIKMKKLEGLRWEKLEGAVKTQIKAIPQASAAVTSGPPTYPSSKGKNWNAIEKEIEEKEKEEKPEGEAALNKLFQEIYGKGSDEVKKAMNKSFMESGGTVLSTNWNEIGKDKVKVQPPDGVEFKKWD